MKKKKVMFSLDPKVYNLYKIECKKRCYIISGKVQLYMEKQLKKWNIKIEEK